MHFRKKACCKHRGQSAQMLMFDRRLLFDERYPNYYDRYLHESLQSHPHPLDCASSVLQPKNTSFCCEVRVREINTHINHLQGLQTIKPSSINRKKTITKVQRFNPFNCHFNQIRLLVIFP